MSHKVEILNIEHIENASRIIIQYELPYDTANFASDGWIYIEDSCGYKGICDDEWICLVPNTQHPLHSDIIKTAGIYYFVWDYYGVQGLSNESFSSEHSFVIQLALQDTGCGFIDPCIEEPNLTTQGEIVVGDIGTSGNCGEGYVIGLDDRDCPICIMEPSTGVGPDIDIDQPTVPPGSGPPPTGVPPENPGDTPPWVGRPPGSQGGGGTVYPYPPGAGGGGTYYDPAGDLDPFGGILVGEGDLDPGGPTTHGGIGEGTVNGGGNGGGGTNDGTTSTNAGSSYGTDGRLISEDQSPPSIGTYNEGAVGNGSNGGGGGNGGGLGGTFGGAGGASNSFGYTNYFKSPVGGLDHVASGSSASFDLPAGSTTIGPGPSISDTTSVTPGGITEPTVNSFDGYPGSNVLGYIGSWAHGSSDDASIGTTEGDGHYNSSIGRVQRSIVNPVNGSYGARAPYASSISSFVTNSKYNSWITERMSSRHDPPSDNELGITTRHFRKNENFTINTIANKALFRGPTKIKSAISTSSDYTYIESPSNFRNIESFLLKSDRNLKINRVKSLDVNQVNKYRELRPARANIHSRSTAVDREFGVQDRGPISSSYQRNSSLSSRTLGLKSTNINNISSKGYEFYRNNASFTSKNRASISVVPSRGAVGSAFHASCFIAPNNPNEVQNLSLEMYIRDSSGKTQLISKTRRAITRAPRRMASLVSTKDLSPGDAFIYFVVKDSKGAVTFKKSKKILLTSPGQLAGSPDENVNNSLGSGSSDFVSGLISSSSITRLTVPIGTTDEGPLRIVLTRDSSKTRNKIGIQTISKVGNRKHSISLYGNTDFTLSNTENTPDLASENKLFLSDYLVARNNPEQAGPNITNKPVQTSGSLFVEKLSSELAPVLIAIVSNHENHNLSLVDFEVGGDIAIAESNLYGLNKIDSNTHTFSLQTPFSFAKISLFETGGNNIVDESATITSYTSNRVGTITGITMSIRQGAWLGVALEEPSGTSLANRSFYFVKIE